MADVVELFSYWHDYPPAHMILRAVYLSGAHESSPGPSSPAVSETDQSGQLAQAQALCGGALGAGVSEMPENLRELADWAEQESAKMRRPTTSKS